MPGTDSWKVWKAEYILQGNKGPKGHECHIGGGTPGPVEGNMGAPTHPL